MLIFQLIHQGSSIMIKEEYFMPSISGEDCNKYSILSPILSPALIKIHLINRKRGLRWWNQNTQELFSLGCSFSPLWIIPADRWPVWPSVSLLHMPGVGPLASALELNEGFFDKRMISASKCYGIIDLLISMLSFKEYENEFFFLWNARVS